MGRFRGRNGRGRTRRRKVGGNGAKVGSRIYINGKIYQNRRSRHLRQVLNSV